MKYQYLIERDGTTRQPLGVWVWRQGEEVQFFQVRGHEREALYYWRNIADARIAGQTPEDIWRYYATENLGHIYSQVREGPAEIDAKDPQAVAARVLKHA